MSRLCSVGCIPWLLLSAASIAIAVVVVRIKGRFKFIRNAKP